MYLDYLNYHIYGDENKKTIICLHGLAQTHKAFDDQLELSKHYRLITLDLRGHGETQLKGHISLEQMANDVLRLMDTLNIDRAIFLGVSLGGLVAQEIYNLNPDRVKALILSNSYSSVPQMFLEMEIGSRQERLDSVDDDGYITSIAKKCSLSQDKIVIDKIKRTIKLNRDTYIKCASSPLGRDYYHVAKKVEVPTLLISGWYDIVTPVILQYQQSGFIFHAKHKVFTSGHLPNIECPEAFNKSVQEFITTI